MSGMQPLEKSLRSKLERVVREARDIAEAAARASLEQLGVRETNPRSYLNEDERKLGAKLRAHGRQLGDARSPDGQQKIDRLVEEVAYQHWHRMLFARFLAENNLLMYPDPVQPIPITLEECQDLAAEEGARNGWELAARFAARMLPQIFRPDSPIFLLALPPEHQRKLEKLLAGLPAEVFFASDSLGWVYQFWQARRKDEIDALGAKIGARELPVVTQLFTEPYMVSFLLDNSLGAWWAARRLSEDDLLNAKDEEELRQKASLPGVPLDYLRFVRGEDGRWAPAAGTFDGWPEHLSEFKALDPCTGSGHFLVAALPMLASMRAEREGLLPAEAVDAVLRENLHGLEIDPRCVELAAFALGFAAWRYPGAGGYRMLPELNLACSGLSISASKEEWQDLAKINSSNNINNSNNMEIVLGDLYDQFKDAPLLGSLINPKLTLFNGNILGLRWEDISPLLTKALSSEADLEKVEMGVVAQGIAKAAQMMAMKYHLVLTNVPYLARGKQNEELKEFCEKHYSAAKNDLATVFLDRCLEFCRESGTANVVIPQNWLFLTSYRKFRERLLKENAWHMIGRLGFAAFEIMDWWAFNTTLVSIGRRRKSIPSSLFASDQEVVSGLISGIDASETRQPAEKALLLRTAEIKQIEQEKQLENPDSRVAFQKMEGALLENFAVALNGMHGADSPRFRLMFWEITDRILWRFLQNTVDRTCEYAGRSEVFFWPDGGKIHISNSKARIQGHSGWGKTGIIVSMMKDLHCTTYSGEAFDISCSPIIPHNPDHCPAIWCFCSSPEYNEAVRYIDQKLNVTNATLVKVPFDLERWQKVAAEKYPSGLPRPYSDDPTQWIFHGHPAQSDAPLQVALARLLGYRWPAELDAKMELSDEARAWVKKCDDLLKFEDDDGIVCIPPVRGEAAAADYLLNLLAAAYGPEWSTDRLSELLKAADHAGKSLESWLREKFFLQHCKLFQHRPFIWHIWDGLHDGFAALVNYHRLDSKLLESLIYTYLGDWISRQKDDIKSGVDGAAEKLAAAEALKKRLEMILEGEAPYDIFVRWKPIGQQPIGWNPDLNDGVRLNIRPFLSVPDVGRKGAGVLREKPNVNWNKDRGKDVESAPWYHKFGGDRINDCHLSLKEKKAARGR
ncbi:MAG: N-6 DNA methylase [Methanothrix sp.]